MKEYLKMADVFPEAIRRGNELVCDRTLIAKFVDRDECEYTAHAINSHDELVDQRDELLAALEAVLEVASQSSGIAGWHLNGELAGWGDLLPEVGEAILKARGEVK